MWKPASHMPLVTGTRSFQPSYILSIQFLASQHHQAPASIPTQVASAPFRVSLFNTSVSEQHPSQLEKRIQARPPPFQVPNTSALHPHHLSVTSRVPSPLGTHRTLVTIFDNLILHPAFITSRSPSIPNHWCLHLSTCPSTLRLPDLGKCSQ